MGVEKDETVSDLSATEKRLNLLDFGDKTEDLPIFEKYVLDLTVLEELV